MNPTLTTLLDDIEAKGKAATPGPWIVEKQDDTFVKSASGIMIYRTTYWTESNSGNAEHIAQMSPDTTLKLVAMLRESIGALELISKESKKIVDRSEAGSHVNGCALRCFSSSVAALSKIRSIGEGGE